MDDDVRTIFIDMPNTVKGYTISDKDGFFTIVLNKNLNFEQNVVSYLHELEHIHNGDFDRNCSADLIEFNAHR